MDIFTGEKGPLITYIGIAVITTIIYYAYGYYKGKGFPGMSSMCSQLCSLACCAFLIGCFARATTIGGWLCAALAACTAIGHLINYIATGGDAFKSIMQTAF